MRTLLFGILVGYSLNAGEPIRQVKYQAETLAPLNIRPTFDNNHLVVYTREGAAVYQSDGTPAYRVPTPEHGHIHNVAVDRDGTGAAAIEIRGRGAIRVLDPRGIQIREIDTESFLPSFVDFGPDHSIWATGKEFHRRTLGPTDYLLLRHYAQDGTNLGGYLPRSSFPLPEGKEAEPASDVIGCSGLRVTQDRIGALLNYGGSPKALWAETDLGGKEIGRWPITLELPAAYIGGVVYAQKNGTLVSLDRNTGQWRPVPNQPEGKLLGSEGQTLVYLPDLLDTVNFVPVAATQR